MRPEPTVTILDDPEAMADAAAHLVVDAAAEAITVRGRFTLALAGGRTPATTYAKLAVPPYRDQVDWAHVWAFFGDERAVPPDHPESNYRMAHEALLSRVPIPRTQVWRIRGEAEDAEAAAADEHAEVRAPLADRRADRPRVVGIIHRVRRRGAEVEELVAVPRERRDQRRLVGEPPVIRGDREAHA